MPVRAGTPDNETEYADKWGTLPAGVDTKAPLSDFYPADVLDVLTNGTTELARWAIPQGQGDLLGAVQGEHPVADAVNEVTTGTPAEEVAKQSAETVRSIAESVQ